MLKRFERLERLLLLPTLPQLKNPFLHFFLFFAHGGVGVGIAAMSVVRPSKFAGPTGRHRIPAMVAESSGGRADCATAADAAMALAASA